MTRPDRILAGRQVIAKIFIDYLMKLSKEDRQELQPLIDSGEAVAAQLTDGHTIGKVSVSKQPSMAMPTDPEAFLNYTLEHHPEEVVPQVRPSWMRHCMDQCRRDGHAHEKDGTIIPGIEMTHGTARYTVVVDPDMRESILRPFIEALGLNLQHELEAGTDD